MRPHATGATRDPGGKCQWHQAAIVRLFAARGFAVVITDVDVERCQAGKNEIKGGGGGALIVRTDTGDKAAVWQMISRPVEHWGQLDVLCSNGGIERFRVARECTRED